MLFVRIAYNAPGSAEARARHFPAHKAHLASGGSLVAQSGPLYATSDDARVGALMIFDAPSLAEVEAFSARDPFVVNGVYDDVRILRFDKTIG
jgi:uncharacterized protein YciI